MAAMLDGRNNATFLHENRFHFPEGEIVLLLLSNMAAMETLYSPTRILNTHCGQTLRALNQITF